MTIPDEEREAMWMALNHAIEDFGMTGDRYEHFEAALAWLDAQPEAPEPDWTTAPDWAQWWAVQPSGVAYWFRRRPMTFSDETTSQWVAHRSAEGDLCELLDTETGLQRGIDWRTTLRRRTEVTP